MGLAWVLCRRGSARVYLADLLAANLSSAGGAPLRFEKGVGLYSQRPGAAGGENEVGQAVSCPADLGICSREIPDRSGVVVLPFLGARLLADPARVEPDRHNPSHYCDLPHFGCGERRGRLDFLVSH